jgi:hypothetical protein
MSEQPVARKLDFSNVGAPEPTPIRNLSSIRFSPVDEEPLPTQTSLRPRTDSNDSAFAIGHGTYSGRSVRRRRHYQMPSLPATPHIVISTTGRYFVIKKKMTPLFNPMTLDEFYATPCPSGHMRIPKPLLTVPAEYYSSDLKAENVIVQTNMMVTLPYTKLKKHFKTLMNPFAMFDQSENAFAFNELPQIKKLLNSCNNNSKETIYRYIWNKFDVNRFPMRRLANAWILRKCYKKMMVIPNYETMEDPSPSNCIEWPDIPNRCSYRIHGDTLLKSMKMYLHHSEYGFPEPLWPKNPTTNAPFTYGQIIHIIYELYAWCGRNKKPVPYILTKFQEAEYCLSKLVVKNRPELSLYACRELMTDINQPDAIEMWLDMIEEYATIYSSTSRDELEEEIPSWITSLSLKGGHHREEALGFLNQWSSIIPDLVQYSRFKYFNRSDWTNLAYVNTTVRTLWARTYHLIRRYIQSKKIRAPPLPLPPLSLPLLPLPPLLPPALDNTAVLSAEHLSNIQSLLSGFLPTNSDLSFQISSEWSSILDESSATDDSPSAVELEYNMMMFNSIINPAVLPRLIQLDFISVSAPAPLVPSAPSSAPSEEAADGLSESFESVD